MSGLSFRPSLRPPWWLKMRWLRVSCFYYSGVILSQTKELKFLVGLHMCAMENRERPKGAEGRTSDIVTRLQTNTRPPPPFPPKPAKTAHSASQTSGRRATRGSARTAGSAKAPINIDDCSHANDCVFCAVEELAKSKSE